MRAGYDRVYADTRRAPIPDLPFIDTGKTAAQQRSSRTLTVMGAAFALVVTLASGAALLFAST
jgi:hypothetical protein